MKRILVAGGAGFIGAHLCRRLLDEGNEVICVDNLSTGRRENIQEIIDNSRFEFIQHDLVEPILLEADEVYHLASPASPIHYQANGIKTLKTNFFGTYNLLGLAKRVGARFLLASTSEIYGDPDVHPQREDYWGNVNPIGERSCYDAETEILTENGWIPFPELKPGVRVATLNADNQVEYHEPDEHIAYPYNGELLHFANLKFDLCVTPNHQLYIRSKTGKMRFLRADEDRHWPSWRVITGGSFTGEEREWFELGEPPRNAKVNVQRIRMDDWLEFLGYYISEGCVHVRRRVRAVGGRDYDVADYNVLIAQKNPTGRAIIAACLSRLGFKFFQSDDHQFRICSMQLAEILQPLGHSGDKYIPREFLRLSQRQSLILFKALMLGDGFQRGSCYVYVTKSKRLADDVQELALRCGYAASVKYATGYDIYRVNIRVPREACLVAPERLHYVGNVYCVNVRNHVICARRNGRAAWCGNCYDEGKRVAEALTFQYYRQHSLKIRVVRIFNTYGPLMCPDDGRVVSNFIVQALRGEPLTVYGDGSQTRSFCYVSDMVDGLVHMMNSEMTGPVNLGNPREMTMLDIAKMVIEKTGTESEIEFRSLPADDPRRRKPDITLARKHLGWEPRVSIEEGLDATIEYFRNRLRKQFAV
jgi:UDP-glucuronate decarboxylase